MDDYDPMDAFMVTNEEQLTVDNGVWQSEYAGFQYGLKRDAESISVNPKEILLHGLNTPLSTKSFGMKMLEQMGYKHGNGLGKNGDGIKEPVQVRLKYDKIGIGHEEAEIKQKEETEKERNIRVLRDQLYYNMKKQQYDHRIRQKADRKISLRDLHQAQSAIELLDEQHEMPRSTLLLIGYDDCDEETLSNHLGRMIEYLRTTYFYCIYCGCTYNDTADLNISCPGWDRDCH